MEKPSPEDDDQVLSQNDEAELLSTQLDMGFRVAFVMEGQMADADHHSEGMIIGIETEPNSRRVYVAVQAGCHAGSIIELNALSSQNIEYWVPGYEPSVSSKLKDCGLKASERKAVVVIKNKKKEAKRQYIV